MGISDSEASLLIKVKDSGTGLYREDRTHELILKLTTLLRRETIETSMEDLDLVSNDSFCGNNERYICKLRETEFTGEKENPFTVNEFSDCLEGKKKGKITINKELENEESAE